LPVLRLAAPRRAGVVPCPKKITLWDIVLTSERRFWGARRVDGSRAVFLLVACCTQEEDAAGASPQAQEIARDSSKKPDGIGTVSGLRAPPAPALPVGNLSEVDR
jgi:hypothetical protein